MRILLVHNSYRQRGGEDTVYEAQRDLLAARGHDVVEYRVHNDSVAGQGRVGLFANTIWSRRSRRELRDLIAERRPDVAHFHNTLPLISPSGYAAANAAGVPVVQTLHNYRFVCPSALLFRDGKVCEDCVGRVLPWPAVQHGCYRESRAASAAIASMLTVHRALGTWRRRVDAWIALTGFQRDLVTRGGVPAERVRVLPNFLAVDPGAPDGGVRRDILFVGRWTEEKGLGVLLDAVQCLPPWVRVRIAGDGPLRSRVVDAASRDPRIEVLGPLSNDGVDAAMRGAAVLAVPSLWYEGLPMTVVEAYARALPVVASALGGLGEVVVDGLHGRTVPPGDPRALADALASVLGDAVTRMAMGRAARACFEARFTADAHLKALLAIYGELGAGRDRRSAAGDDSARMVACPPRRSTVDQSPTS